MPVNSVADEGAPVGPNAFPAPESDIHPAADPAQPIQAHDPIWDAASRTGAVSGVLSSMTALYGAGRLDRTPARAVSEGVDVGRQRGSPQPRVIVASWRGEHAPN